MNNATKILTLIPASKTELEPKNLSIYIAMEDNKFEATKKIIALRGSKWDGVGYFVDIKYKEDVEAICRQFNLLHMEQPTPENLNDLPYYDPVELSYQHRTVIERDLSCALHEANITYTIFDDLYNEENQNNIKSSPHSKKILDLLFKRQTLEKKIAHLRSLKQNGGAIDKISIKDFGMKFIANMPVNLLTEEAPQMQSLLTRTEEDKEKIHIPQGITCSLIGAGGIGKTHLLAQLAISITTGIKFLGAFNVTKPGAVALILGENSINDAHRLLRKTIKGFFDSPSHANEQKEALERAGKLLALQSVTGINASFIDNNGSMSEFYKDLLDHLTTNAPEDGWACIIIDPASRFMGPEAEKDNAAATQFISMLEAFTKLKGNPTVIFGHHMNKSAVNGTLDGTTNQTASRGASALTDGVRLQLNLEPIKDHDGKYLTNKVKLRVTKTNHTAYPKEDTILIKNEWGHLSVDKPPTVKGVKPVHSDDDEKDSQPNFSKAFDQDKNQHIKRGGIGNGQRR